MKVKFWGTRGSIPVSHPESIKYGGNTTCLEIKSSCVPGNASLVVDTGTGFVPLSREIMSSVEHVIVLYTHWHHDHTQGLFLSPLLFMKHIRLSLYGPVDGAITPRKMIEHLMQPPFFPVHYHEVLSHIECVDIEHPATVVIVIHPEGGHTMLDLEQYERRMNEGRHLPIGGSTYPVSECLVITMYRSRHPEQTICYRFEEKPTGSVFVFLTDHENEDGIPLALRRHLVSADLLVMDAQYPRKMYDERTAGFGHGTPDYCAWVAAEVKARRLGLTHHDPGAMDADVEGVLQEALDKAADAPVEIFLCADYQEIDV